MDRTVRTLKARIAGKTTAQIIASEYTEDGEKQFEAINQYKRFGGKKRIGMRIGMRCKGAAKLIFSSRNKKILRYTFYDNSVLVIYPDIWDYGYSSCLCMQSAGHTKSCLAQQEMF